MDGAGEGSAEDDPEGAGKVAELRGEGGSDEGSGAGDGGEVVAEDDPFVGGFEVVAIAEALGRGGAVLAKDKDLGGDELAVEAVGDEVDAGGGDDDPDRVDGFTAVEGDACQVAGAGEGNRCQRRIWPKVFHDDKTCHSEAAGTPSAGRRQHGANGSENGRLGIYSGQHAGVPPMTCK